MNRTSLALLGVAAGLTACLNSSDPFGRQQNYGFVILETELEEGLYVTDPNAIFYRTGPLQLPSTSALFDTCITAPYSDEGPTGTFPPSVSAGTSIQVGVSGNTAELTPVTTLEGTRYVVASGASLPLTPGDSATVTIPGAVEGFPDWMLKAKTSEAFTPAEVPTSEQPANLPLRWTAASAPGSKMLVSLRYTPSEGTSRLQLYCELIDDGSHDVRLQLAEGWRTADPTGKEAVWSRWRITAEAKAGAVLLVISTFEVPMTGTMQ